MANKYRKVWKVTGNHFPENKHSQKENTFLKTKPNFSLTGKCFPFINFSNGKQT
jgi:hypothetical protein